MRRYKGARTEDLRELFTIGLIIAVVILMAVFFMRGCGILTDRTSYAIMVCSGE